MKGATVRRDENHRCVIKPAGGIAMPAGRAKNVGKTKLTLKRKNAT